MKVGNKLCPVGNMQITQNIQLLSWRFLTLMVIDDIFVDLFLTVVTVKKKKLGKNPDVDTSFLPDREREVQYD